MNELEMVIGKLNWLIREQIKLWLELQTDLPEELALIMTPVKTVYGVKDGVVDDRDTTFEIAAHLVPKGNQYHGVQPIQTFVATLTRGENRIIMPTG